MELTPDIIIKNVSDYFRQPIEKVLSTCRKREFVQVRQVSMYFIKIYIKGISLADIGKEFPGKEKYKNHATVLYSIRIVKNDIETKKSFTKDIALIDNKIKEAAGVKIEPDLSEKEQLNKAIDSAISVIAFENRHLRAEIIRLNNKVNTLQGRIYGLKMNKRKLRKKKKPALFKLSDIKPIKQKSTPELPSKECQVKFTSPFANVIPCNGREHHGYRVHAL